MTPLQTLVTRKRAIAKDPLVAPSCEIYSKKPSIPVNSTMSDKYPCQSCHSHRGCRAFGSIEFCSGLSGNCQVDAV